MPALDRVGLGPTKASTLATATNAVATATKAGVAQSGNTPGKRHYVHGFTFTTDRATAAAGVLQLKSGATVIDQYEIESGFVGKLRVNYTRAKECGVGEDAILTIGALGASVKATLVLDTAPEVD